MVKQAMYKNYHTGRGVIILKLKVQELQLLELEGMLYLQMMPINTSLLYIKIKSNQQVQ